MELSVRYEDRLCDFMQMPVAKAPNHHRVGMTEALKAADETRKQDSLDMPMVGEFVD